MSARKSIYAGLLLAAVPLMGVSQASARQISVVIETRIKAKALSIAPGMKSTQTIVVEVGAKKLIPSVSTGVTGIGTVELKSIRDKFVVESVHFLGQVAAFDAAGQTASGVIVLPNINYRFSFTIDLAAKEVVISGCHDGYPSYKVTVDGKSIYDFEQEHLGALFGTCDTKVARRTKKL